MSISLIRLVNICTDVVHLHIHVHTFLLYHRLVYACLHVRHKDAMGTNAGFLICTCTCKPWLHGINLTCKGDHAIGKMLCATQMDKLL